MHRHVKIEKFINIQLFIPSFLFYSSSNFCFLKFYSKIFLLSELVSFTLLLLIRRIFLLKGIMFSTWTITLLYLSVIIREINHAIENYYCITVTVKYSLILAIIEYLRNIIAHFIFLFLKFLKIFKLLTNFQIFFFPSFSQQQNICCFTTKAHSLRNYTQSIEGSDESEFYFRVLHRGSNASFDLPEPRSPLILDPFIFYPRYSWNFFAKNHCTWSPTVGLDGVL